MKYRFKILLILAIIITLFIYEIYENLVVDVEENIIINTNYQDNLEEIKIANVSDIHMPTSKYLIDEIILCLEKEKPDVILLTGDIIDKKANILDCGLEDFFSRVSKIAKCYAISGNHETRNYYNLWKQVALENNIIVLDNKCEIYEKGNNKIAFLGLKYGSKYNSNLFKDIIEIDNIPKIVLEHNPAMGKEIFSDKNSIVPDYIFSGHAHGGQVRIPFIKQGLFAPGQGLFPKYTSGIYNFQDDKKLVLSRGLGNGTFPIRINNRIHIPIVIIRGSNNK